MMINKRFVRATEKVLDILMKGIIAAMIVAWVFSFIFWGYMIFGLGFPGF